MAYTDIENCWICGGIADSEEHKFKASDIKKYHGKKIDAYYISGGITELNSYKDKSLKFPKVICITCNNTLTHPHDDAYDKFVEYCFKNHENILKLPLIDFQEIYGDSWQVEKSNLYRYYAKHAGCKIVTSNLNENVDDLASFIKGENEVNDFVLMFEQKAGVKAIMNGFNLSTKYFHLYNSETVKWIVDNSLKLGGWSTNNYITANWFYGKGINTNSENILNSKYDIVLLSDSGFFDIEEQEDDGEAFSRLKFIDQYVVGFENGHNKTPEDKIKFFENLATINNNLKLFKKSDETT